MKLRMNLCCKNLLVGGYVVFSTSGLALAQTSDSLPPSQSTLRGESPSSGVSNDWRVSSKLSGPIRGFQLATGEKNSETKDPLAQIDYSPSPSLEGTIYIGYKGIGFSYSHTLAAASLDSNRDLPSTKNEIFHLGLLLDHTLWEISSQKLSGMQTDLETAAFPQSKVRIARTDMNYSDFRARWVFGDPVWGGADRPNSLANFYTSAVSPEVGDSSLDVLLSVEAGRQNIYAESPFIPLARQSAFGTASSLSQISSVGLGAGAGLGLTVLMHEHSFFSMAFLLGGNYNVSNAHYEDRIEDISGFGVYTNTRVAVTFVFGQNEAQEIGFKALFDTWQIPAKENTVAGFDAGMAMNYGVFF